MMGWRTEGPADGDEGAGLALNILEPGPFSGGYSLGMEVLVDETTDRGPTLDLGPSGIGDEEDD